MSVLSKIAAIDKKFAWSFFGFVLAVFFGAITIHNEFIKNPNPALSVQIVSDTNVLDVRENVPELKIVYGDVDIKSLNQTLSVVIFKVQNLGGAPILNNYYEDKAVPTLSLTSGKFIKVEQIGATNEYLLAAAQPAQISPSTLHLPRVIMEPGESYTIKALLLHGPRTGLPFKASGKVAGMKEISVLGVEAANKDQSFWSRAFSGSITTQLLRAPAYFFGFILLLFSVIAPLAFISDRVDAIKRKRMIKQFKKHNDKEPSKSEEAVLGIYLKHGLGPLAQTREVLADEKNLRKALNYMNKAGERRTERLLMRSGSEEISHDWPDVVELGRGGSLIPVGTIQSLGIASLLEDGEVRIDQELEAFLSRFIDFVNIKQS